MWDSFCHFTACYSKNSHVLFALLPAGDIGRLRCPPRLPVHRQCIEAGCRQHSHVPPKVLLQPSRAEPGIQLEETGQEDGFPPSRGFPLGCQQAKGGGIAVDRSDQGWKHRTGDDVLTAKQQEEEVVGAQYVFTGGNRIGWIFGGMIPKEIYIKNGGVCGATYNHRGTIAKYMASWHRSCVTSSAQRELTTTPFQTKRRSLMAGSCRLRDCHWHSKWRSSHGTVLCG